MQHDSNGTRGTRLLRLRSTRGPSVFDPVQLLRLVVIFAPQYGELRPFPQNLLAGIKGEMTRGVEKGMVEIGEVEQ